MRQAHYLLRPLDTPHPTPAARRFFHWLTEIERHDVPLVRTDH